MTCDCDPGTEENGWIEFRCRSCVEVERAEWRATLARVEKLRWGGRSDDV